MHALEASRSELWERLSARNANLTPGTFAIDLAQLDDYIRMYEPPAPDEFSS